MSAKGAFVVLEGIDGAGTTTQADRLVSALRSKGMKAHLTREPSGGPVGTLIRQVLSRRLVVPSEDGPRPPGFATMALLFAADRMDHLESEISPRLANGEIVVCDRYDHSSLVYQSATSSDPEGVAEWTRRINEHARRPDLVFILDLDPSEAKARRADRGDGEEIYDADALQRRLAEGYRECARYFPGEKIVLVDASRSVEAISLELEQQVLAHLAAP